MSKYFLALFFSCLTLLAFGQEKITITGKATDALNFPLADAEVIIGNKADSTKISSTITDDNGSFKFEISIQDQPV